MAKSPPKTITTKMADVLVRLGYTKPQIDLMSPQDAGLLLDAAKDAGAMGQRRRRSAPIKSGKGKSEEAAFMTQVRDKLSGTKSKAKPTTKAAKEGERRGRGRPVESSIADTHGSKIPEDLTNSLREKYGLSREKLKSLTHTHGVTLAMLEQADEDPKVIDQWLKSGKLKPGRSIAAGAIDPDTGETIVLDAINAADDPAGLEQVMKQLDQEEKLAKAAAPVRTEGPAMLDWERPGSASRPYGLDWERRWNAKRPSPSAVPAPEVSEPINAIAGMEEGEEARRLLRQDPLSFARVGHPMERYGERLKSWNKAVREGGILEETLGRASKRSAAHALLSAGSSKIKKVASLARGRLGSLGMLGLAAAAFDADAIRGFVMGDEDRSREDEKIEREWQLQSAMRDARLQYRVQRAQEVLQNTNPTWYDLLRGLPGKTSNEIVINEQAPNEDNLKRVLAEQELRKDPETFAAHFGISAGE